MMFKNLVSLRLLVTLLQGISTAFRPATEHNHVLVGHVFRQFFATDWFNCIQACHDEPRCISYNYERSAGANGLCELNDCGVEDLCDRDKSLIYMVGFVFQQIREGKNGKTCGMVDQNPSAKPPDSDFAIQFPYKGTADYIQVWGMPRLTQFTVCSWMQSNATVGTIFSYAVPTQFNEIVIMYQNGFQLHINKNSRIRSLSVNDGRWHHLCVCWNNTSGVWKFYKDGQERHRGEGLKTGHTIQPNGTLILTQEQDSFGGRFSKDQSFQGTLTNVNMWDQVLPPEKIQDMSQSCLSGEGNVYKWSDFKDNLRGKPRIVIPSPCKSPTA
ncbi:hypothetical protein ACROYT_G016464 [Oculina patagonica]